MITAAIIGIILLYILSGAYKGFLWSVYVLGASIISCALAFALIGPVSSAIRNNEYSYNAMLSYTEGAESIYDVELRRVPIDEISEDELEEVMERSDLVFPLRDSVYKNITLKRFESEGIVTLGDYFNESLVRVIINIASFIIVYLVLRVISTFIICWADYTFNFKKIRKADFALGGAIGLLRGMLGLAVIFMLVPILLTILNFDSIRDMVEGNTLAAFFHNSNLLLMLIPGK